MDVGEGMIALLMQHTDAEPVAAADLDIETEDGINEPQDDGDLDMDPHGDELERPLRREGGESEDAEGDGEAAAATGADDARQPGAELAVQRDGDVEHV